ncbi:enolase-phosphatase E1-like [Anopheles darlingi]|uniref:enolase-phosphatase E1-like n=1 Tax=Anopheles darlingi TaxID=43151 RepID=UPI002100122E|nr:enolase-phosphatase E1-like [Anopheles darlingi]
MAAVALSEKVLSAKSIICDVEGTTTSISFVKETLFPYALKNVEEYLRKNWSEDATKTVVQALREQADEDKKAELEGVIPIPAEDSESIIPDVVKNVEWQMSQDRKTGSLKTLQGLVWTKGYKDGTIKGHVYDDVQKAFEQWTENGRKVYIYSSGSVEAQKLLFEHSEQGNLLKYLTGHYDTKVGGKREKESYQSIVKNIDVSAEDVLFLTDIVAEAKAAKEAGLNVVLLERPGNAELSEEDRKEFTVIKTFSDLSFETVPEENGTSANGKRKIDETIEAPEEDKAQEPPAKLVKVEDGKKSEEIANGKSDEKVAEEVAESKTPVASKEGEAVLKKSDEPEGKKEAEEQMEVDAEVGSKEPEDKKAEPEKQEEKMEEDTILDTKDKIVEKPTDEEIEKKIDESKTEAEKEKDSTSVMDVDEKKKEAVAKQEDVKEGESKEDDATKKIDPVSDVTDSVKEGLEKAKSEEKVEDSKESKPEASSAATEESKAVVDPVEVISGVESASKDQAEEVATEAKEETKKEDAKSETTTSDPANNDKEEITENATTEKAAENKATATDAAEPVVDDKPAVATNGNGNGVTGTEDEKNDSDKENDTSTTNCDDDDAAGGEKTNGTTNPSENGTNETETPVDIKTKTLVEPVSTVVETES